MAYVTRAQLRALPDLTDADTYTDAMLDEGIAYATEGIEDYCGSYDPDSVSTFTAAEILSVRYGFRVLGIRAVRSITAATNDDGTTIDVTAWTVDFDRQLVRTTDTIFGDVRVDGTACLIDPGGTVPVRLAWAAKTIAAAYVKDLYSRIPGRALAINSEFGTIPLAQAGAPGRPTNMPDVNAVLVRFRDTTQIVG